jgi:bilin biosynthesis protein
MVDIRNLFGLKKPDIKRMEREKDVKGLLKLLSFENDESIRREAAFILGKITDSNNEPFSSNTTDSEFLTDSNEIGTENPEDLINLLKNENRDVRKSAESSLVKMGEPAVETLIKSLNDDSWRVRWHSAEILGEIEDPRAVKPLIESLNDPNSAVRSNSSIALCEIGQPAVETLINALNSHKWQLRWQLVEILGEIGDPRSEKPIEKALQDENPEVRMAAETALKQIQK